MKCLEVRNVSKTFIIVRNRAQTVSGFLIDWLRFWRRLERVPFTALYDLSLSVAHGETLGIIGSNGSGKSTLLKLIAGIYAPTSGTIQVRGRLVALLELGAGFHSELSGRENILLNGALYGYTRAAMARRVAKLRELQAQGRTLVIVSHSLELLSALCSRALWLERGRAMAEGAVESVIAAYKAHSAQPAALTR